MLTCRTVKEYNKAIASFKEEIQLGYLRVSTEKDHQDSSIARQLADFADEGCNIVVIERESGTSVAKRSLYLQILQGIESKQISKIFVGDSSRLNRNEIETTYFERLCEINNVGLYYLDEPELNADTFRAKQLRKDRAIAAETYSRYLSLNLKKGNERARKNLKPLSRIPTFGYRFTKDRYYEIDWARQDLINVIGRDEKNKLYATGELGRFLIESYLKHETQNQAFRAFKKLIDSLEIVDQELWLKAKNKSQSWFNYWIKDPTIRGHLAYKRHQEIYSGEKLEKVVLKRVDPSKWEIHKNCHPALVSREEALQIDRILENNRNKGWATSNSRRDRSRPAPLSKILRCNCCKLTFVAPSRSNSGERYRYYRCVGRRDYRCDQTGVGEKKLVKSLLLAIQKKAEELTEILYQAKTNTYDPRWDRVTALKTEAENLLNLYRVSGRRSYQATWEEINAEIAELEKAIAEGSTDLAEKKDVLIALKDPEFWASMSRKDLHDYLKAIVHTAWVENKSVIQVDLLL